MTTPIILIGAGGHAKVCIEVLRRQGLYRPVGCIDASARSNFVLDVPIIGGDEKIELVRRDGVSYAFCCIGQNDARLRLGNLLRENGYIVPPIVDPSAFISASAMIGLGVLVMPRVVVNADAIVQEFSILNTGCIIEHDCKVGVCSHVAPSAVLAGSVTVGNSVLVGAGSVVRPGIRIGDNVVIGCGSAVVKDIPDDDVVFGVPATRKQLLKKN